MDYHTHTYLCGHASGKPIDYVRVAVSRRLAEVGVSDHLSLSIPEDSIPIDKLNVYVEMVEEARRVFQGEIEVRLGFEVEYSEDHLGVVEEMLESIEGLDYTLLSIHKLGDWIVNSSRFKDRYARCDLYKLYEDYFERVCNAASTGLFNIVAHLDLPKVFGFKPSSGLSQLYRDTARSLAKTGVCVEVNTAGLRKPISEVYPAKPLLAELRRFRVPVTLGSDAHRPEDVGYRFDYALRLLSEVGYRSISVFKRGKRSEIPIL